MLGKIEILAVILILILLFYIVISFGAGAFSKKETNLRTKKYLKSVNILLAVITVVGVFLVMFLPHCMEYIYWEAYFFGEK